MKPFLNSERTPPIGEAPAGQSNLAQRFSAGNPNLSSSQSPVGTNRSDQTVQIPNQQNPFRTHRSKPQHVSGNESQRTCPTVTRTINTRLLPYPQVLWRTKPGIERHRDDDAGLLLSRNPSPQIHPHCRAPSPEPGSPVLTSPESNRTSPTTLRRTQHPLSYRLRSSACALQERAKSRPR